MLGKKYLAWKGPLVLVYIAMIVCTVIFINNNNSRLTEQSSFSSDERSRKIENLQKECEKLKQQVRDSSYPYQENQYLLQAIFNPPQINITRINEVTIVCHLFLMTLHISGVQNSCVCSLQSWQ